MSSSQPIRNEGIAIASAELVFVQPHQVTFTQHPSEGTSAEFKVGVRSLPYLADHGFHDLIVLPGSFYLEMALVVHAALFKERPGVLRNVKYENPVILSDEDTTIQVKVSDDGDRRVAYTFYEANADDAAAG